METKELAKLLKLTEVEAALLKARADKLELDPLSGQIHLIKRKTYDDDSQSWKENISFMIGIEGFRLIAERSGQYDGQDPIQYVILREGQEVRTDVVLDNDVPVAAIASVYRKGISRPFINVAHYRDYVQKRRDKKTVTTMWGKWTIMLPKCAEAGSFRKGWSDLNLGEAYEPAEIPLDETTNGNGKTSVAASIATGEQPKEPWTAFDPKPIDFKPVEKSVASTLGTIEKVLDKDLVEPLLKSAEVVSPVTEAAPVEKPKPAEAIPAEAAAAQVETPKAPAAESAPVKMATPTQVKAICKLGASLGENYDEAAFGDVTSERAGQMIKELSKRKREADKLKEAA